MKIFARIACQVVGVTIGVVFGGWAALEYEQRRAAQRQKRKKLARCNPGKPEFEVTPAKYRRAA